jgi:hypothetical protein
MFDPLIVLHCPADRDFRISERVRDKKVETGAIHQQHGWNLSVCGTQGAGANVGQLG